MDLGISLKIQRLQKSSDRRRVGNLYSSHPSHPSLLERPLVSNLQMRGFPEDFFFTLMVWRKLVFTSSHSNQLSTDSHPTSFSCFKLKPFSLPFQNWCCGFLASEILCGPVRESNYNKST